MPKLPHEPDDDLAELPPLDGDDETAGDAAEDPELVSPEDGEHPLDDEEAGDSIACDEIDTPLDETAPDDDREFDTGDDAEGWDAPDAGSDEGEGPVGDDGFEFDEARASDDDRGEEGVDDEGGIDDALPALDGSVEEGDGEWDGEVGLGEGVPWDDAVWGLRALGEDPTVAVDAREGAVVALGDRIFRVRPASLRVDGANLPAEVDGALAIAIDPARRTRIALATRNGLVIVDGSSIMAHVRTPPLDGVAWGRASLHAKTEDGVLLAFSLPELSSVACDTPPALAIANDDEGTLAVLTAVEGRFRALVSNDGGATWDVREAGAATGSAIAVDGDVVAVAAGGNVLVGSKRALEPITIGGVARHVAFAGDDLLVVATMEGGAVQLLRIDRGHKVTRIAELSGDDGDDAVHGVAWDRSRGVAFLATSGGLVVATPPPRH